MLNTFECSQHFKRSGRSFSRQLFTTFMLTLITSSQIFALPIACLPTFSSLYPCPTNCLCTHSNCQFVSFGVQHHFINGRSLCLCWENHSNKAPSTLSFVFFLTLELFFILLLVYCFTEFFFLLNHVPFVDFGMPVLQLLCANSYQIQLQQ